MQASYSVATVSLDTARQKEAIAGTEGTLIYGVTLAAVNATDPIFPTGADFGFRFGVGNEPIQIDSSFAGIEFPCGHDKGVYIDVNTALAGKSLKLVIWYTAGGQIVR